MLSPIDMLVIGAAALLFFGPDQLPKVARRVGRVVREVQMTSQSFVREMERAADEADMREMHAPAESDAPERDAPERDAPERETKPAASAAGESELPF